MGILRTDRVSGLGGANAITGSAFFAGGKATTTSSDYNLGTDDFTIECFVYFSGKHATLSTIFETRSSTSASDGFLLGRFQTSGHENKVELYTASDYRVTADRTVENDTWVHIAVVRASATTKVYVDGTAYSSTYSDSNNYSNTEIIFGKNAPNSDQYQLTGFISNFHVVKGTAIYTANFTPPTNQIQKRSDTVFLGFQSASDVTREETGKIITFPVSGHNSVSHGPDTSKSVISSRFTPNSPVGFSTTTDVGTQFGSTFDGVTTFDSQAYFVPPGGNTRERNRGRGIIRGGMTPNSSALTKIAQYIEMSSGGNTIDFGDGLAASYGGAGLASATRGVYNLGATSNSSPNSLVNTLEFVTIANTANAIDFGDLYFAIQHKAPMSNQTRGIFAAGITPANRVMMDFITIATTGDAQDFGDSIGGSYGMNQGGQAGSSTRGLIAGGSSNSAPAEVEKIQFVTFASLGNAQDFGDLVDQNGYFNAGASSGTRALFGGGGNIGSPFATVNTIQFVTIATTGNATDFGDRTVSGYNGGALSNSTRGCFVGGVTYPGATRQNVIDFVNIATTGNASDFGDIAVVNVNSVGTMSDSHGGL